MIETYSGLDLDRLLRLRLVVARIGEMDLAKWWNTQGMLGSRGASVLRRGLPRTHFFAQARVVFAVARSRCAELFSPPGCITLWELPAELEDQFDERWQSWLDDTETWGPVFEQLSQITDPDLLAALDAFGLLTAEHTEAVSKFKRSAEKRAVLLPGSGDLTDDVLTLLAAGFARGEASSPAIPYFRLDT